MILYPHDWEQRWPAFANAVKSYMADGSNSHDDAPDALTMIIEAQRLGNYQIVYTGGSDDYDTAIIGPWIPFKKEIAKA
jgi:hypothetical protein